MKCTADIAFYMLFIVFVPRKSAGNHNLQQDDKITQIGL
jgi:hypothetical protein